MNKDIEEEDKNLVENTKIVNNLINEENQSTLIEFDNYKDENQWRR